MFLIQRLASANDKVAAEYHVYELSYGSPTEFSVDQPNMEINPLFTIHCSHRIVRI